MKLLDSLDWDKLDQEFRNQANQLRNHILSNTKPIALNGKNLDGAMFSNFVESIVSQLNSGGLPNLADTYTYVCKAKCNQARDAAIKLFEQKFNHLVLPCTENTLE